MHEEEVRVISEAVGGKTTFLIPSIRNPQTIDQAMWVETLRIALRARRLLFQLHAAIAR